MGFLRKAVVALENLTYLAPGSKQVLQIHTYQVRYKATVISGKKMAEEIQTQLKKDVLLMLAEGYNPPQLTTIVVGDDYVSHLYVKHKMIAAKSVGIITEEVTLDPRISEEALIDLVLSLNKNPKVNAILVQLPLPSHISERKISDTISPLKDVDGFSSENMGRFCLNMKAVIPCTALAVREIIKQTGINTKGKNAVVCGRSKNVGLPIGIILHSDSQGEIAGLNATTTICHRFTPQEELKKLTRSADILVSAAGVPNLITQDMVKKGACVIDVGLSRCYDQATGKPRLHGDIDFCGVQEVASFITPVPGGVGPMTVAMVLRNTVNIARQQHLEDT